MTDELESRALELMAQVEAKGGAVAAVEDGFVQREILSSALAWQKSVESEERTVVGVNAFTVDEEAPEIFRPDPGERAAVFASLDQVRAERDPAQVEVALRVLEETARGTGNLMDPILAAVEARVTLGEVSGTLEKVFGRFQPPDMLCS